MAISEAVAQQVEYIIRGHLARTFPESISFDPILVEPIIDSLGEDNLYITVVCDGEVSLLDPAKLNAVSVAMWPQLDALGFYNIPIESYVDKADYDSWTSLSEEERWIEMMNELASPD